METVELCEGGPRLSPIVAGVWRIGEWGWSVDERLRWIERCMALGVTSFDHADIYGGYRAQALFGEALARKPSLRDGMQLVSKVGIQLVSPERPGNRVKHYDTRASHVVASVEQTLADLRTDHLDLLLVHRPDALMDADEVARAFERLREAGKVRHLGASNFLPWQFDLLHSRVPLATNQIELHPLRREPLTDGTLDQCQRLRVRPMIWSPLAGGAIFTSLDERTLRVRGTLEAIARARGCAPSTIAYAWLLRLPSRPVPVAGSRRTEALREATAALDLQLDPQEWTEIWQAAAGHEVP